MKQEDQSSSVWLTKYLDQDNNVWFQSANHQIKLISKKPSTLVVHGQVTRPKPIRPKKTKPDQTMEKKPDQIRSD